jgi:hypothetical protein
MEMTRKNTRAENDRMTLTTLELALKCEIEGTLNRSLKNWNCLITSFEGH